MKFKKLIVLDKIELTEKQKSKLNELASEIKIFNDTPIDDNAVIKRIADADAILTSWTSITKNILEKTNLKYIGIWATGYNWIDIQTAKQKKICVTNVPGYATESVAELVIGQLISLMRNSIEADKRCRQKNFSQNGLLGQELKGKTIAIIGLGKIGSRVAELASAFGMKVIYFSRTKKNVSFKFMKLNDLLKESDVVSIHTSSGNELLGEKELALLKNNAIVINFGVAGSENEIALIKELKKNRLKAILDHFVDHKIKDEFANSNNVLLSPEIGFYAKQALESLSDICIENAISFLQGKSINVVSS